jgi:diguanylate cyclase (GGDEF)-like protein/PAS domain S-box-containing protein
MNKNLKQKSILIVIGVAILTILFPVLAGFLVNKFFSYKIVNIPLHSALEVSGGVIATVISFIFYVKYATSKKINYFNYMTFSMLVMGIVDIFHGIMMPGELFVWLHSTAVFLGGVLSVGVWLRESEISPGRYKQILIGMFSFAVFFSILSIKYSIYLPTMLNQDGSFTTISNFMNVIGGIGFFIASSRFVLSYMENSSREDLLFMGITMLFGISGILFLSSQIWDMQWWLWHFLRLFAYVTLFYYLYISFKQEIKEFYTIFETTKDGIAILDLNTNFLSANSAYLKMTGFSLDELLTKSCAELSAPEDIKKAKNAVQKAIEKGFVENFEKTCILKNGKKVLVNMSIALMPDQKRLLISTKNITDLKQKEKELKEYVSLIDKNIITSTTDIHGNITYVSKAFCKISGYTKDELLGKNHRIVKHPDMDEKVFKEIWEAVTDDKTWRGEIKNLKKGGGFYWVDAKIYPIYDDEKNKIGYTAIRQDITDKKKIEYISITDALTSIYNRRHFNTVLPKFIEDVKKDNGLVAFLILDIDFFKQYNDTYGHQMGDDALVKVAGSIKKSLGANDGYCFRLGGEEFGMVFQPQSKIQAYEIAELVRKDINELHIEHKSSSVDKCISASIGLVCKNANDIEDEDAIYKEADDFLYEAKKTGRNKVYSV